MNTARRLSRTSLSDQVRNYLLEQIISGAFTPGERLIELKIAAEMETSQAPVREALKELEALGLVEIIRNRGARVRIIDDIELREIYDVRAQLEGYAAQEAAINKNSINEELKIERDKMLAAAETDDYVAFSEHNMQFHRLIIDVTENQTLIDFWQRLNIKMRTFINVQRKHSDLHAIALSHNVLIDTIASQDGDAARLANIEHVIQNRP